MFSVVEAPHACVELSYSWPCRVVLLSFTASSTTIQKRNASSLRAGGKEVYLKITGST